MRDTVDATVKGVRTIFWWEISHILFNKQITLESSNLLKKNMTN